MTWDRSAERATTCARSVDSGHQSVGPWPHGGLALCGRDVGPCVGPFAQAGLDEALGLSVGAWPVGAGADVFDPGLADSLPERVRSVIPTGAVSDSVGIPLSSEAGFDGRAGGVRHASYRASPGL